MILVGQRLRSLRESINLSQMKLGKLAGLQQAAVNRYEHGQNEAPYRVLMWYADYFDVSMDYIFGRCETPQGELYNYQPKIENEEIQQFVEMCFDPKSPMNERLKQSLLRLLKEGKEK